VAGVSSGRRVLRTVAIQKLIAPEQVCKTGGGGRAVCQVLGSAGLVSGLRGVAEEAHGELVRDCLYRAVDGWVAW